MTGSGSPPVLLGSGWAIPHDGIRTGWTVPLIAGMVTLALTVAAAGAFLGRHVVRPLTAIIQATRTVPYGEADLRLPATRVGEVNAVATALQSMSDNLRAALGQQAETEEQRRQFIGAIAHDLRTPLFTLRAYLDGLSDGLATSPQKTSQYLQTCRTSADALDRLITDLFSYARMEYLGQSPRRDRVDLGTVLRTAAQAHQPKADAKHITLTVTAPAAPCTVTADEHLLSRVLGNLIDIALRHTPEHGHIDLRCARTDNETVFTVTDTGPGIAPADLPHLFAPLSWRNVTQPCHRRHRTRPGHRPPHPHGPQRNSHRAQRHPSWSPFHRPHTRRRTVRCAAHPGPADIVSTIAAGPPAAVLLTPLREPPATVRNRGFEFVAATAGITGPERAFRSYSRLAGPLVTARLRHPGSRRGQKLTSITALFTAN